MASNNSSSSSSSSSSSHHNYKMFMCFNRKFKINETQPPFDVVEAFNIYTNKGAHMNSAQLHRFMVDFQGEDHVTENDAVLILDDVLKCRRHLNKFSKHLLTLEDFFFFLFSDDFNPPLINQVRQDMTAPMQQYFIFTGHNSYLTGNQLSSDCSDVPIIKALHKGVRVIELDIWPNSAKDDVNVLHGRTLTTPVPLIKCLKSIKEHAFAASQYPVIITLEDHLTPDLQAKVAKMVTEVFGEMLFCPEAKHFEQFPSPEELKFRIILSTKPPKEYLEDKLGKEKGSTSPGSSGDETPNDAQGDSESDQDEGDNYTTSPGGKSDQVGPHYKHLIAIHAGKPKNGTRQALRTGLEKVRRLSLSEQALDKAAENYGPDVVRFTQKNFLRIYPKGTRIRSSNYEPLVGWQHGAQMVAFNMQGYGKSLWLMNGMFRSNGGCGYVKKPDFLMTKGPNDEVFDPKAPSEVKKTLKVRVYMGDGWRLDFSKTHFDTFSPPDFYVKLRILGVPADVAKDKTKVIEDEWTPVWDQEFKFPLTVPELALLQFEVREHDMSEKDDFGGQACLPISELKTGFRSIRLYDRKGEKLPSVRLLVKFQFT